MIPPEETDATFKEWTLDEIKQISRRNFELAKFLFGASAASFAVVPFLEKTFVIETGVQVLGLLFLGISAVLAILIAEPADFKFDDETNLSSKHKKYARLSKRLRRAWMLSWLIGVAMVFWAYGVK